MVTIGSFLSNPATHSSGSDLSTGLLVPPLIVTGANHRYARTLLQFLRSAERHGMHRAADWVVYDLGLSANDRERIERRYSWAPIRSVNFSEHPPHVNVSTGSFAWKPILIQEAAIGREGPVFWFDSATIFREPLSKPIDSVLRTGFWTLKGQTPLMGRADARVIAELNVPAEILHLPERVAGAVGFDTRNRVADLLLQSWANLARDPRFILPSLPDPRHRYDQTLLSALLLTAAWQGEIELGEEEVDISSVSPAKYLTTRNKLSSEFPEWLDAPARAWYHVWKAGDRLALRIEAFWKSRVEGLLTCFREHYHVVRNSERITGPAFGYFADPFLWRWEGEDWLFVERFDYVRNRGRIAAVNSASSREYSIDGEGMFGRISCHASFPFLFEQEGQLCMIPETSGRRTVDLYSCAHFPAKWRLLRRLLVDIDAADSMVVRKDGIDYLFTSVKDEAANRHLAIYVCRDLMTAPLEPHPVNLQRLYAKAEFGTGRCGGFLDFAKDGRLLRFMQQSRHHYGQGGQWMEITELTPQAFAERPLQRKDLPEGFPERPNSHHLSFGAGHFIWDVRDRVRQWP